MPLFPLRLGLDVGIHFQLGSESQIGFLESGRKRKWKVAARDRVQVVPEDQIRV